MVKYKIEMYVKVEDKQPKLYDSHEAAYKEREKIAKLQPNTIFVIEPVY